MAYVSDKLRNEVAEDAGIRCGFCRSSCEVIGTKLEIEHLIPESKGGKTVRENLWMACGRCNRRKSDRVYGTDPLTSKMVRLFNPRTDTWNQHFEWSESGLKIIGLTDIGRATEIALELNDLLLESARETWIVAGDHPPND